MTESLEALRGYVHFLHEREGVRQVRLTRSAQQGLARLVAKVKAMPDRETTSLGSRRLPGDGQPSQVATAVPSGGLSVAQKPPPLGQRRLPTAVVAQIGTDALPTAQRAAATTEPPLEITGSTKEDKLRHLAERASVCVKCPHLVARRHTVVFGVGNPEAKLMFVGEAPGEEEDLQGEPFVGRAGQLLTKMILAMGLTREQVYIANIVKCRPDMPPGASGNRKPTKQEMETCVPYLRAQIDVIQPTVMVALGATAEREKCASVRQNAAKCA